MDTNNPTTTELLARMADEKGIDLAPALTLVLEDTRFLDQVIQGLQSNDNLLRENCFLLLTQVSLEQPEVLYPDWDGFVSLLDSPNGFQRAIGLRLIAGLTGADTERRFDDLFERYYALLDDPSVMVARYLVQSSTGVIRARPELLIRVMDQLLRLDETNHPEGRKALIKADALVVFDEAYADYPFKASLHTFAQGMLDSSSPKARRAAAEFLENYT